MFKIDRFVFAILITISLAYLFPFWGSKSSPLPLDTISSIGIALIFFFYGLKLSPEKLKSDLTNWKLHLLIQLVTFLLFPLFVLAFHPFSETTSETSFWLPFFFLAALPSTVSSSVVMVSMAKGNVPAAIFNASISGLIGIVITPLWMGFFLSKGSSDFELGDIYIKLLKEILLPVILGVFMHRFWGQFALKHTKKLATFDKSVILLIIYKSYSDSFQEKVFSTVKILDLIFVALGVLALFYGVYFISGFLSKKLNFSQEDKITAQFCASKKSLVHGTIFSKILFPSTYAMGIVLLPIMLYHAFQLFIISIIATRLGKENKS
ncbi:solute carrier family 10 (sodium/bile acid cotransporter), member 7 [Lishizhenia tianjinensis]|uniref:Solute carrier family 10 (Sodium/bile acid cotransporter), member 7 n=1 Tax=Lishizhenia tianjinensis TaxID=477690 RepID=A0A1I6YKK2_9FLAO|nr:bile acid:sodium symporter family protein [Lishizhenia tianjinensis]SFT51016.1 solute carrier family 10 (sodium/bile acid cotransporter), member 7 [Lishizhenia tianjinensis]